tara:strand:+ start:8023 stop:9015 length:993 start_codon:yes stop_codon:yes gene_type:complete
MFNFSNPWVLIFLIFIPLLFFLKKSKTFLKDGSIQFSNISHLKKIKNLNGQKKINFLLFFQLFIISTLIFVLAGPRLKSNLSESIYNVIDINLILDISSSMRAEDFKPNRLESAKETAKKFIEYRRGDRIGLLVFAGESYIQCPLTLDYKVLLRLLQNVKIVDEKNDGTAIGMAIAHGINRLRNSNSKSRIIILLSDGSNNAGELEPVTAANFAKEYGIKIYAIGVGANKEAPFPYIDPFGNKSYVNVDVKIDEKTLKDVAYETGGLYFRAKDEIELEKIYDEINKMERSKIKIKDYTMFTELFSFILVPLIILLIFIEFLYQFVFKKRM